MEKNLCKILFLVLIVSVFNFQISFADFVKDPKHSLRTLATKVRHSISSVNSIRPSRPKKKCTFSQEKLDKIIPKVQDGFYTGRIVFRSGNKSITGNIKLVAGNDVILGSVQAKQGTKSAALPFVFSKEGILASSEDYILSLQGPRILKFKSDRCVKTKSTGTARLVSKSGTLSEFKGLYNSEDGSTIVNIASDGSVVIVTGPLFKQIYFFGKINEEGSFDVSSGAKNMQVSLTPTLNDSFELTLTNQVTSESESVTIEKFVDSALKTTKK